MTIATTATPNALPIQSPIFVDEHGFFFENFNKRVFTKKTGVTAHFVQDNYPIAERNLLRSFYYKTNRTLALLYASGSATDADTLTLVRLSS